MKKDKKIVIVITLLVSIIMTYSVSKIFITKKENKPFPEVKLKEKMKVNNLFAIMIPNENGDGYKEYKSEDNNWPNDDYQFKEAKCIDNNGNLIDNEVSFDNSTKTVILETDKTVSCTIYFDKSLLGILREKDSNKNISTDLQGGMYRYQGTDDVANWICFGTTDNCGTNDNLIDKYMYRIIGITSNGELYLLKETFLKEESTTRFQWHSKSTTSDCKEKSCEWPNVDLFKRLNGNGEKISKTNIFIDSKEYDYLKLEDTMVDGVSQPSDWYKLIEEHNWMYGDTNTEDDSIKYNGDAMYGIETGNAPTTHYVQNLEGSTTVESQEYYWNHSVPAKIGLMYMHDILYAYQGSSINVSNNDKVKKSWIHFQKDGYNSSENSEWLSTLYGVSNATISFVLARFVKFDGFIFSDRLYYEEGVRPVFYLTSDIKISGEGTKEEPFIIEIN